jgi:hypothetical protein
VATVKTDTYDVVATAPGYANVTQTVDLSANKTVKFELSGSGSGGRSRVVAGDGGGGFWGGASAGGLFGKLVPEVNLPNPDPVGFVAGLLDSIGRFVDGLTPDVAAGPA